MKLKATDLSNIYQFSANDDRHNDLQSVDFGTTCIPKEDNLIILKKIASVLSHADRWISPIEWVAERKVVYFMQSQSGVPRRDSRKTIGRFECK